MTSNLAPSPSGPRVIIESFGFLHGTPASAAGALLVDLRTALRNPADDPALIEMTGLDDAVIAHVLQTPGAFEVISRTVDQAQALLTVNEPKNLVTRVLIGCQGGRHRSVVVASSVAQALNSRGVSAEVEHAHVERPVVRYGSREHQRASR